MLLVESSEVERQLCLLAVDDAVLVVVGVGCALLIGVDGVEGFPLLREIFLCQLTLVELVDPLGQFVHIEGAGDESSCLVVEPIGTVGMMSGRKDGSAVFQRHANDLGAVVGGKAQLVADGCRPQIAWRHVACLSIGAYGFHGVVAHAVDNLSVFHKGVAGNAVY